MSNDRKERLERLYRELTELFDVMPSDVTRLMEMMASERLRGLEEGAAVGWHGTDVTASERRHHVVHLVAAGYSVDDAIKCVDEVFEAVK